jgi:hypothetical protein
MIAHEDATVNVCEQHHRQHEHDEKIRLVAWWERR